MLSLYLAVLDDQSSEEQFIDVYNTYKRLVYHTAYKIMGDSYLTEDVLQEVFLYVAKNFSKIHRENGHELIAYLVSCSRSRAYDMLRKQREEPLEEIPDVPDDALIPDDAAGSVTEDLILLFFVVTVFLSKKAAADQTSAAAFLCAVFSVPYRQLVSKIKIVSGNKRSLPFRSRTIL